MGLDLTLCLNWYICRLNSFCMHLALEKNHTCITHVHVLWFLEKKSGTCMSAASMVILGFAECLFLRVLNTFPKQQILDSSILEEFADNNVKFHEYATKFSNPEENIVGKGEIACVERRKKMEKVNW